MSGETMSRADLAVQENGMMMMMMTTTSVWTVTYKYLTVIIGSSIWMTLKRCIPVRATMQYTTHRHNHQ